MPVPDGTDHFLGFLVMMICLGVVGSLVMGGCAILEEERRGPTFSALLQISGT